MLQTRALEMITIGLLGAIAALASAAATLHSGHTADVFYFMSAIAAGGAIGRWPLAFPTPPRRQSTDADFDA